MEPKAPRCQVNHRGPPVSAFRLALGLAWAGVGLAGEPPQLDWLFPAGGQVGTRVLITAGGSFQPWPAAVWTDDPGLQFVAGATNGVFHAEIAAATPTGPHLVRVYTLQGASIPRLFVVGANREVVVRDDETNGTSQVVSADLPFVANGRIQPASRRDEYVFPVPAGSLFEGRLVARRIDSGLQASLELLTEDRTSLVTVTPPAGGDPVLICPLPMGGTYRLVVKAATAEGGLAAAETGPGAIYRLECRAEAWEPAPQRLAVGGSGPLVEVFQPMAAARTLAVPGTTRGVVSPEGREILYSFSARAHETWSFTARAGTIGSPLAPVLRVFVWDRSVVAQSLPAEDAALSWVVPVDGDYLLGIADAGGRGGPTYSFQLEVERPKAHFSAVLDRHAVRVERGQTVAVEVKVLRPADSEGVLLVSAVDLPDGVRAVPVHVNPGVASVRLMLAAGPGASPANQPFRVVVSSVGEPFPSNEIGRFPLVGRHATSEELLLSDCDRPWITVLP